MSEQDVKRLQYLLKKQLVTPKLRGFITEKRKLSHFLRRTVSLAQSGSMLVVGPRGVGKSLMIKTCVDELKEKIGNFTVVSLHGCVHVDDNLALKAIIQQLHAEELDGNMVSGSYADHLLFVLQSFKSGGREASQPIVFIIDEFQLFCTHKNQTLLYNLFNVAQTAQAPICVVGITCSVDVTERLEKRIKSRFSHHQIHLYFENSLEKRLTLVRSYLTLPETEENFAEVNCDYLKTYNDTVYMTLRNDENVISFIKYQLEIDPSELRLKSWIFLVLSRLNGKERLVTPNILLSELSSLKVDVKVKLLTDLSVLELCLVIAMNHHDEIYDGEPFNFEMVTKQYMKFAGQNSLLTCQKPLLFKTFERIKDLELIQPISNTKSNSIKKEYQLYTLNVLSSQVKEAVETYSGLPTDVYHWASNMEL